jgi:hypothetical protein
MNIISPQGWGARLDYDLWSDQAVLKDKIVVHYNGGRLIRAYDGAEAEKAILRSWERYHIDRKRWRGIAYGWAVGMSGSVYRLRGWNNYAAHTGDADADGINENKEAIPVAFILGGTQEPSPASLAAFRALADLLEVDTRSASHLKIIGHKDISSTDCPGEPLYALVRRNFDRTLTGEPIIGTSTVTVAQAKLWAKNKNAHQRFIDVADIYWTVFPVLGVRPEVGYAQSAKETGYGHFPGIIKPAMHNWCGLKTRNADGDDVTDHASFPNDTVGVTAHRDHLFLYARGPVAGTPDPRHFDSIQGTAPTVELLSGKWAYPGESYGQSIVEDYIQPMETTIEIPAAPALTIEERVERLEVAVFG